MALTPAGVYAALASARAAGPLPFTGIQFDRLLTGIAQGITLWAVSNPANVLLQGIATGTVGSGQILPATTRILVPSNVSVVRGALSGAGLNGPLSSSLAAVISVGVSSAFSTLATYSGTVAGVGAGTDASKITVANAATLAPLLIASIGGASGVGPALPLLTTGLSNAVSGLLLGGTGTGIVTGGTGSAPASGASTSVVL